MFVRGGRDRLTPVTEPDIAAPQMDDGAACERVMAWPAGPNDGSYLSDDLALRMLSGRDLGVLPDLSRPGYRLVKRVFDVVASGLAIAVLFVPAVILSAAICIKSPGAGPLYTQWRIGRVGRDGSCRPFKMFKFRSMVPHAEDMLSDLQDSNEASGPMFKIKKDPRIIPVVGNFIRRHSIDELPQLINVFIGDMSLIGPRPGLPNEVAQYDENTMGRLVVKPGCGGPWQVSGRSDVGFERMVELDLEYVRKRSLGEDFSLIVRTLRVMLSGDGAA